VLAHSFLIIAQGRGLRAESCRPLACWEKRERKEEAYAAVLDVLRFALSSPNPACVESALHGLGHMHYKIPRQVEQIVQSFLAKPHIQNEDLLQYARNASYGYVL